MQRSQIDPSAQRSQITRQLQAGLLTISRAMSTTVGMARYVRLVLVCLALGAVPPLPARAVYAEVASAPVAAAVASTRVVQCLRVTPAVHAVPRVRRVPIVRVAFVSRRYLIKQSLLL
jgi:hypothetical protein